MSLAKHTSGLWDVSAMEILLIAAAPELLAAGEIYLYMPGLNALDPVAWTDAFTRFDSIMRAAITKAPGGAK